MKLSKSVAELQREHVVLELECIDRMYLNAYVPQLTNEAGVAGFVRGHLGYRFASTKQLAEMTEAFVESIMQFTLDHKIDLVRFQKGQRKDDVMQARVSAAADFGWMCEAKRENTRFGLRPMSDKTASQKRRSPAKPVTDLVH